MQVPWPFLGFLVCLGSLDCILVSNINPLASAGNGTLRPLKCIQPSTTAARRRMWFETACGRMHEVVALNGYWKAPPTVPTPRILRAEDYESNLPSIDVFALGKCRVYRYVPASLLEGGLRATSSCLAVGHVSRYSTSSGVVEVVAPQWPWNGLSLLIPRGLLSSIFLLNQEYAHPKGGGNVDVVSLSGKPRTPPTFNVIAIVGRSRCDISHVFVIPCTGISWCKLSWHGRTW